MTGVSVRDARVLVMAKAPVPGQAKTRLAATIGDDAAAHVAAAALLDTLAASVEAVGVERCVLALAGDLDAAASGAQLRAALDGWTVIAQRGDGFGERLAHAHLDAGPGPVVQIGMDTPQVTGSQLREAARRLHDADTVLGLADDGGWWVLGRTDPAAAAVLANVAMSTPTTGADTETALVAAGHRVVHTGSLTDVDTAVEAAAVALAAPSTYFARAWAAAAPATIGGRP